MNPKHIEALQRIHSTSYGLERCSADKSVWSRVACHSFLWNHVGLEMIETRYQDRASGLVGEERADEVVSYIQLVYHCFEQWIECSLDEMLNKYPGYFYIKVNAKRLPGGVMLGILNCMRGVEEQSHFPYALAVLEEEHPELNNAQMLILSHMLHPLQYPSVTYNLNHSVWLPQHVHSIGQIKDFSFLEKIIQECRSFHEEAQFHSYNRSTNTQKNTWRTMVPDECINISALQDALLGPPLLRDKYNMLKKIAVSQGSIDYFLNSNEETLKGVVVHEKTNSPW